MVWMVLLYLQQLASSDLALVQQQRPPGTFLGSMAKLVQA